MQELFNLAYDAVYSVLDFAADLLGFCPFGEILSGFSEIDEGLGWLNWFVPVGTLINIVGIWAAALIAYYVIGAVVSRVSSLTK